MNLKWNMERYMGGLRGKKGKEKCYNLKLNDSFKSKPKEKIYICLINPVGPVQGH